MWTTRECKGQVPDGRHSASIVACGDKMILFGGTSTSTAYNDVHVLDTKTWEWTSAKCTGSTPAPRWGHCAHLVPGKNQMIVYAGCDVDHGPLVSMALLDLDRFEWSRPQGVSGAAPTARSYHCSAMQGSTMYVFGGEPAPRDGSVYSLDLNSFHWDAAVSTTQSAAPEPRKKSAMFATNGMLWVSGGVDTAHLRYMDDLRIFDIAAGKWSDAKATGAEPGARAGHCVAVHEDKVFLWGGLASQGVYPTEMQQLNLGSRSWFKRRGSGTLPIGRVHHCSAVMPSGEFLVFGGISSENEKVSLNDVHTFMPSAY